MRLKVDNVKQLAERLKKLLEEDESVLLAYLFGSSAKGRDMAHSDIDVAVFLQGDAFTKIGELKESIAKTLSVPEERVDVVDISRSPLALKHSIAMGLKLIDRGSYGERLISEVNERLPDAREIMLTSLREAARICSFSLNPEVLHARIQKAREEASYLRRKILPRGPVTVSKDETLRRAMARSTHEMLEAILDTCRHVVSAEALGPAETYADFPRLLGEHGLMPTALARKIEELARLRNVLVHRYIEVDYPKLFDEATDMVEKVMPEFEEWVLELLERVEEGRSENYK